MDTLTASSVSSRPWVLQFFRNLFGSSRRVTQDRQRPNVEAKDIDDANRELLVLPVPDAETTLPGRELDVPNASGSDVCKGLADTCPEELSLLKEISARDTTSPIEENKQSILHGTTGWGMGDSDIFAKSMISSAGQEASEKVPVPGEKKEEPGDIGRLGKDGVAQTLGVDDGVCMAAESVADVQECNVEEEKEHLLKGESGKKIPAGLLENSQEESSKAERSPWNRLLSRYKQRRRIPLSKVDISAQPIIEDEATLDQIIYGIATPKSHVSLPDPTEAAYSCPHPEDVAREMVGDCETAEKDMVPNTSGSLEQPKV